MRLFFQVLKVVSIFTLMSFCWTYLPLYQIPAYAAQQKADARMQGAEGNRLPPAQNMKPEERFEKALEEISEKVGRAKEKAVKNEDVSAEIEAIKNKKAEIESLDVELRKEFNATEKKLKDANLNKEILSRHYKFVKNYEDSLSELKANVDAIEKAKTPSALTTELAKAQKHLAKVKPPKKRKPFDPNKLPHKARQVKHAVLEEKKPEVQKINPLPPLRKKTSVNLFDEQKKAQISRPILVASNGSLDGLISASPKTDVSPWEGALSSDQQLANLTTDSVILNSITAAPTIVTHPPASAADLAETPEIQFTPAILAKAQELEHKPVKIYEWVRNNVEFVPTYGSIQGADMCLQTKQCNDIDTASLLIALLRASNISARYVYGTIEIPIEKAKNWVGDATDPMTVGTILATNGIPAKLLISGGTITAVQFSHVWVNAWIDFFPSWGARHKPGGEDIWIPLDASFKQYNYTHGIDTATAVPFDAQTFVNQIQSTATINQTDGSVTNVNSSLIQQTLQSYQTQVQNYIQQNYPNATVGDIIGKKQIIKQEFQIFLGTLPYKTVQIASEFSQVPDNLRYKVTFVIQNSATNETSLSYTTSIAELAGKRSTLSYAPATASDEQVINTYGGIFNVPAYMVNVKPQIKIEGVVAAAGSAIGLGKDQTFNMRFVSPAYGTEYVSNQVTAGAYYGIGINANRVSGGLIIQRKAKLESVKDTTCVDNAYSDDCGGELLYTTALGYFYMLNGFEDIAAQSNSVVNMKDVSEAIVSVQVNVSNLFGIPKSIAEAGMMIDVDRNIYVALSKNGDLTKVRQFMITAGQMSSAMEHGIFELMYQTKGVSTMQVLQLANSQGIPIYTIDQNNISFVLPILQVSSEVKTDIQNAVNAGKNVVIPQQNVTYYTWTGTGYIVLDAQTGAGAYMISTNLAGGGQCIAGGGLTVILLTLIGSTGTDGSHNCSLLEIIHILETPLQFLVAVMAPATLGGFLIYTAISGVAGVAGGIILGLIGLVLVAIAVYFAIVLFKALIDSYQNHAHNKLYERRIYGARYDC